MVTSNAESAKGISSSHCFNGVTMKLIRQPQEVMQIPTGTAIGRLAINTLATWKSSHFSREIGKIPNINQRWFTYELQATLWLDDHGVASGEVVQRGRSGHSRAWWEVVLLLTQLSLGKRCLHHFVPRSLKTMPSCQKIFTSLHWQSHKFHRQNFFWNNITHLDSTKCTRVSWCLWQDGGLQATDAVLGDQHFTENAPQPAATAPRSFFLERFDPKICNIMLCNHGVPDSFLDDSVVSYFEDVSITKASFSQLANNIIYAAQS